MMETDEQRLLRELREENARLRCEMELLRRQEIDARMRPLIERLYGPPHHLDSRGRVI